MSADQQAAMTAYLGFEAERVKAEQSPQTAKPAALMQYGIDPAVGTVAKDITLFQAQGLRYRGTPPIPRASVQTTDLGGSPHPFVLIYDCPTAPSDWKIFVISTGKPLPLIPSKVAEPFGITARVESIEGRWYVRSFTVDGKATCHA